MGKRILKKLPENFKPDENIDWNNIFIFFEVPEEMIEEYKDKIDCWDTIALCQNLSEGFINKFIYKFDLGHIFQEQKLSEEFLFKHHAFDKFAHRIKHNKYLSKEFIEKHTSLAEEKKRIRKENTKKMLEKTIEERVKERTGKTITERIAERKIRLNKETLKKEM